MSNDSNKRQVPVTSRQTGKTRLSDPMPVNTSRKEADSIGPITLALPGQNDAVAYSQPSESKSSTKFPTLPLNSAEDLADTVATPKEDSSLKSGSLHVNAERTAIGGKATVDIETLEQFIEYAYARKGQRIVLKPKVEKRIAQSPRLDDAALSRLHEVAASDILLAVPRQLLLLCRDIVGFSTLRAEISSFVSKVMFRHPVFADAGTQAVLRTLPEDLPATDVLAAVVAFTPREQEGHVPLKNAELQVLRRNAANLFITWLANNRGMNSNELAALLFKVIWHPAARRLADDSGRLRALTEVEQAEGVGLACLRFHQQAIEARNSQDQALREANLLREQLVESETQRQRAEEKRDALQTELDALRVQTTADIAEMRRKHTEERTHLHHGQEQLGGRLIRRLEEAVETLEVGLSALRNKTPRVEVMLERAELVVDALRAEIKNLREE